MSFQNLKRNRDQISKLIQAAEATNTGGGDKKNYDDDRIWKPTVDKSGNGYAVIRFLPSTEGQELPWVRYWDHGFKGPTGMWYIENSLTSIGQPDPVGELNSRLWNTGNEADKEKARTQKRRLHHVTNIMVVNDPGNPANEGKVFLYKFGKKIFDKLTAAMQPEFEDEEAINPFDFWQGANFKLKIKKVAGFWNYDSSEFASPTALLDDDEALEALWKKEYSLAELVAADQFKSYEDLKKRLDYVIGNKKRSVVDESFEDESEGRGPAPVPVAVPQATAPQTDQDEEDALSYFSKLAEG